jgi:hypothetical protein
MSGGSFDYAYHRISDFGESLSTRLRATDVSDWNTDFVKSLSPETQQILSKIAEDALNLAVRARAAEWLFSGDYGEQTFLEVIKTTQK